MPLPRFVWLALSLFGFASCEKEITVKVPDHVSQLVLHSVSATGDSIVMRASRSVGILEYTPGLNLTVADATVVLYDNGLAVDTLGYDAMMEQYVSEHTAEPGHIYTLHAQTPTLGPVFASAGIPASVALNSIQRFQNAKVNSNGGSMDELVLTFNDDGMSTDYYRVSLFTGGFFFYGCAQSNDPGIESPSDDFGDTDCLYTNGIYLSDGLFNGQEKELRIFVDSYVFQGIPDSTGQPMEVTLRFEVLSESYFRFLKTNDFAEWNYGNPFAEPSNVYTNVTNGFGVFAVVGRNDYSIP